MSILRITGLSLALAAEIQNCHLKFKMKICEVFLESIPFLYIILSQVTLSINASILDTTELHT